MKIKWINDYDKFTGYGWKDAMYDTLQLYWCVIAWIFGILGAASMITFYYPEGTKDYWFLVFTVYFLFCGGIIMLLYEIYKEAHQRKTIRILMDNMEKM
jgi:hypothetical protein